MDHLCCVTTSYTMIARRYNEFLFAALTESLMATVLVVDDMTNIRKFISLNLANNGHVVLEAENAEQALHILSEREPSVIVLDLALPEMDGWEFLTAITERYPSVASIPV